MRKIIAIIMTVCLASGWIAPTDARAYNQTSLTNYLSAHNSFAWSVMGLKALGATTIDANHLKSVTAADAISLTAPILAITAINQNPHTFATTDYVAQLKTYYQQNQLGDSNLLNDDIFGLLALVSAGENRDSAMLTDLKNNILNHQNQDGGWSFATSGSSDTNMTAAALLALKSVGIDNNNTAVQAAWQYLHAQQKDDGGFSYDAQSAGSDSASTAWVLWSLNAYQTDLSAWTKSDHNPRQFLEDLQNADGYFLYQAGANVDGFTPNTSAYAAIALAGKFLPLNIYANTAPAATEYSFRIEGASDTVCEGKVAGPTALDIVKNASGLCGFTYHISDTAYGPYLDKINNDQAAGMDGWLFFVNNASPSVGAADYQLQANDTILWYFGSFEWLPSKISLASSEVASGQSLQVTAQGWVNGAWQALSEATIYYGAQQATTDNQGQAILSMPDGYYKIYAQKSGFVRSNKALAKVGAPGGRVVNLQVNVTGNSGTPPAADLISFVVEPGNLDFGSLAPGQNASRNLTISNTGTSQLKIESTVEGDRLFIDNLKINNLPWALYTGNLAAQQNLTIPVKLNIPSSYTSTGSKTGAITFWSTNL